MSSPYLTLASLVGLGGWLGRGGRPTSGTALWCTPPLDRFPGTPPEVDVVEEVVMGGEASLSSCLQVRKHTDISKMSCLVEFLIFFSK